LEIQPPACAERIGYQAEGDLPRASAILGPLHPVADNTAAPEAQVYQAILEQRTGQIIFSSQGNTCQAGSNNGLFDPRFQKLVVSPAF
jgi:hypothetical protein